MAKRFERGESPHRRDPELAPPLYEHPVWWHHHGAKMRIVPSEFEGELLIKGSAAEVKFARDPQKQRWNVDWKVKHSKHTYVQGRTEWQDEEFDGAFGVADSGHIFGEYILDRFGGDSAEQGGYIRWKNYLNIPNPGTGHDYDSNVSVYLTEEMMDEALKFKEEHAGHPLTKESSVPTTIAEFITKK